MAERDDAPLADEPQRGSVPNDMPTGMPAGNDAAEPEPLGPEDAGDEPEEGAEAMPGIPTEGDDPYSAG
ncbi:MAG: hypothetical protein M3389_09495 [Actinomycetota bacterium]|nr:hypothetical protein [Actinomycetota bacterium]